MVSVNESGPRLKCATSSESPRVPQERVRHKSRLKTGRWAQGAYQTNELPIRGFSRPRGSANEDRVGELCEVEQRTPLCMDSPFSNFSPTQVLTVFDTSNLELEGEGSRRKEEITDRIIFEQEVYMYSKSPKEKSKSRATPHHGRSTSSYCTPAAFANDIPLCTVVRFSMFCMFICICCQAQNTA